MKLTAQNVEDVFLACLYKDGEDTSKAITVEGVMMKVGFNPERLEKNREQIINLLSQCHDDFFEDGPAKGMTFLNFCQDRDNELWTGVHAVCDNLICLGLAIKKVVILLPRAFWGALPGGMPYLAIKRLSDEA